MFASDVIPATLHATFLGGEQPPTLPHSCVNSLVKFVNLFREDDIVQELVDVLSFSRKQDSVRSQYTQTRPRVVDGLYRILHLVQSTWASGEQKYFSSGVVHLVHLLGRI